jgi:hypothetical protein
MALMAAAARAGAWRAMTANSVLTTSVRASGTATLPRAPSRPASQASEATEAHVGGGGAGAAVGASPGAQPRGPVPRPREGVSKVALKSLEKRLELLQLPQDVSGPRALSDVSQNATFPVAHTLV